MDWKNITAIIEIFIFYLFINVFWGIGCPILWLMGISCAGCGMTRAWISLLQLDLEMAFYYHPLFWLPIVVIIICLAKNKMPKDISSIFYASAIVLFLVTYILRMLDTTDTIVIFQPWKGVAGRTLSGLLDIL